MAREPRTEPPEAGGGKGLAWARALPYLVLLGFVVAVYGETLRFGILEHDSFPLIEASRVRSWSDFAGIFTEKFMDGRFGADFYRPVQSLSFALDHALFGLEPFGWQLDHLLLFFGCCAALFALLERALGRGGVLPALCATLAFLLYPGHWEVLPAVARRQDLLAPLFVLLAVRSAIDPLALARGRPRLTVALFTLLAVGSKETGVVALPLVAAAAGLYAPCQGLRARTSAALRAALPAALALALFALARRAVLGSLQSYAEGHPFDLDAGLFFLRTLLFHPDHLDWDSSDRPLLAGILALGLATGVALTGVRSQGARHAAVRVLVLGATWLVTITALMAWVGSAKFAPWHVLSPVVGASVLLGGLLAALAAAWRERGLPRALLCAAFLPLAVLVAAEGRHALFFGRAAQWRAASERGVRFLDELERRLRAAPDGTLLVVRDVPVHGERRPEDLGVRRPSILAGHSIAAWTRMTFPDRRILVTGPIGAESHVRDGVVVALDVAVLDWSGAGGEMRRLLDQLAVELGAPGSDLGLSELLELRGPAAAKYRLLELVLASRHERAGRLVTLARYFESIGALGAARRALAVAQGEAPADAGVLSAMRDLRLE